MMNERHWTVVSITGDDNVGNAISPYCSLLFQFNDDRSVRDAVLGELKPLLLRVRRPSRRLFEDFLVSLTDHRIEDYRNDEIGGYGRVNVTATAFKATVQMLRRRASDARDTVFRAIVDERTAALRRR